MKSLLEIGQAAKQCAYLLNAVSTVQKNDALLAIASSLRERQNEIIAANQLDLNKAKENAMSSAMLDRLALNEERIEGICQGVLKVCALDDPIGEVLSMIKRPNGLLIGKRRVPLGVIGIIYEARPNVTVDAAVLCLKSSNAVILRGGKEAINSNIKLVEIMQDALKSCGLDGNCIQIIEDTSHETANEMMRLNGYIDVLIPRGGSSLISTVVKTATVPVIETGVGNCHIYVDDTADLKMGADIIFNAKTSRPSVCNAAETLLVARSIAKDFLPLAQEMLSQKNVELRGCKETAQILKNIEPASEQDYFTEFLDYILAIKVVDGVDEAIRHINHYGTKHSEAIVTNSYENAQKFLDLVDAAAVYVNASTRFTDGFEFGLGAEIGISTQKMHARGPMGLNELTSIKYIIYGSGQIR